jgi:hypothetical protein
MSLGALDTADKENVRPKNNWNDTGLTLQREQSLRSRTINHKSQPGGLGFKQNSTTTFSFNNTGNQEDYIHTIHQ